MNGVPNDLKHTRGVLSMARAMAPNSAGSQFFIMHEDAPHLDGQYAAFGKVIEGMENVDKIATCMTGRNDKPIHRQAMKKVTVDTFGVDYPEPERCNALWGAVIRTPCKAIVQLPDIVAVRRGTMLPSS